MCASLVVEDVLRATGRGDENMMNSTTTDYISPKAAEVGRELTEKIQTAWIGHIEKMFNSKENELVALIGLGQNIAFSESVIINVDEFVARDLVEAVKIGEDGTITLIGHRVDEAGVSASFTLRGRDEYDLNDIDKVLDAVKWDLSSKQAVGLSPQQQAVVPGLNADEMKVFDQHLTKVKDALRNRHFDGLLSHELRGILFDNNVKDPANVRKYFVKLFDDMHKQDNAGLRGMFDNLNTTTNGSLRELSWAIAYKASDDQIRQTIAFDQILDENKDVLERLKNNPVAHEEKPYVIQYGTFPGPEPIFGDIHLQFKVELPNVFNEELSEAAQKHGGEIRLTNGVTWFDFSRQDDAEQFANEMIALNTDRIVVMRESAKQRQELVDAVKSAVPHAGDFLEIKPTDIWMYGGQFTADKIYHVAADDVSAIPTDGINQHENLISMKDGKDHYYMVAGHISDNGWYSVYDISKALDKGTKVADLLPAIYTAIQKRQQEKALEGRLADVMLRANELGIEYHPVGLKGDIVVSNFDDGIDTTEKTFQYATVERDGISVFESLYDVFEPNKGNLLQELPITSQKEVLDCLYDSMFAEKDQMVVVYDKQEVPSYALPAIINGDLSGIEDAEDEKNIRAFMDKNAGYIFDVKPNSEGFVSSPAFGLATDCETVFMVKPVTPEELLKEKKLGSSVETEKQDIAESKEEKAGEVIEDKDIPLVKEMMIRHLRRVNVEYYKTDSNISSLVNDAKVTNRKEMTDLCEGIIKDIMNEAEQREPGLLSRYVVDSIDEEAHAVAEAAVHKGLLYAEIIRDKVKENMKQLVSEINAIQTEYNKLRSAEDSTYGLSHPRTSYNINVHPMDLTEYALIANNDIDSEFITSFIEMPVLIQKLEDIKAELVGKYPQLANIQISSEVNIANEQESQESSAAVVSEEHQDNAPKKEEKSIHEPYQKYYVPEGTSIKDGSVFKYSKGPNAGKYAVSAIVDGKKRYVTFETKANDKITPEQVAEFKKDLNYFFASVKKDVKPSHANRETAINNLTAKYFGSLRQEYAVKADTSFKVEGEKERKKVESVDIRQGALLAYALDKASKGVMVNDSYMIQPSLYGSNKPVTGFNMLMMALHSDMNGYKTSQYVGYGDAKDNGFTVKKGMNALPFNWYSWDRYVNTVNSHDVISRERYEALDSDLQTLYKPCRAKDVLSIFNLAQTTFEKEHGEEYKAILAQQESVSREIPLEQKEKAGENMITLYSKIREDNPNSMIIMRQGDNYELYGSDAIKAHDLLGLETFVSDKKFDAAGDGMNIVSFSTDQLPDYLAKLVRGGNAVIVTDKSDCYISKELFAKVDSIYDHAISLVNNMMTMDGGHVMVNSLLSTDFNHDSDLLVINDTRHSEIGEELPMAVRYANEVYREVIAYTGAADRLGRVVRADLLPSDIQRNEALVQELGAAVLMLRDGLPASISEAHQELIPYWQRELTENPQYLTEVEQAVNNAIEVIDSLNQGKAVNYTLYRSPQFYQALNSREYSITEELSNVINNDIHGIITIKDKDSQHADVIIAQGATFEVNNELEDVSKNRIIVGLRKEGYQDIHFYNSGGSKALLQPNSYFEGKDVTLCKISNNQLEVVNRYDLAETIANTAVVELEHVDMIPTADGKRAVYVKAVGEEPLVTFASRRDIEEFLDVKANRREQLDSFRMSLGRKYYNLLKEHPNLRADILMPKAVDVNVDRLSNVNIRKDRNDKNQWLLFADIDGKHQQPVKIDKNDADRFWLVSDKDMYKYRLAALLLAEKLGQGEGLSSAQFPGSQEGHTDDSLPLSEEQRNENDFVQEEGRNSLKLG